MMVLAKAAVTRTRRWLGVPEGEGPPWTDLAMAERLFGQFRSDLVGIVTGRDMRFEKKLDDPVRHIMTKKDRLVTVREGASDEEVLQLLHRHRIEGDGVRHIFLVHELRDHRLSRR